MEKTKASAAEERVVAGKEAAAIRRQLERIVADDALRSSRRSVAFLKYIVEQTLDGNADDLKERTIGVEVFGKSLTYDTNLDHAVRTAATELRKRLAIYYGDETHRNEIRIALVPGSYVPQFRPSAGAVADEALQVIEQTAVHPAAASSTLVHDPLESSEPEPPRSRWGLILPVLLVTCALGALVKMRTSPTPRELFC